LLEGNWSGRSEGHSPLDSVVNYSNINDLVLVQRVNQVSNTGSVHILDGISSHDEQLFKVDVVYTVISLVNLQGSSNSAASLQVES